MTSLCTVKKIVTGWGTSSIDKFWSPKTDFMYANKLSNAFSNLETNIFNSFTSSTFCFSIF